jgi:soluble P-type ATPase
MIEIEIPGRSTLRIAHLVLDFNGTLAVDGEPIQEVTERLIRLAAQLEVHVVTADTFGKAAASLEGVPCALSILPPGAQDQAKLELVQGLGADSCACIGNGNNDRLMLKAAALGVAVVLAEGACTATVTAADVVCTGILDALDLLSHPLRLVATLRC